MSYVLGRDSQDHAIRIIPVGMPGGTPINGGSRPAVALVIESEQGEYMGHMELSPTSAQMLGEEFRKAAEAAQTTLEEGS